MLKKYLVIPDYVVSKNDGDEHFVSAADLIRLYGVHPKECVLAVGKTKELIAYFYRDLIKLTPKYDGDYTLEKK